MILARNSASHTPMLDSAAINASGVPWLGSSPGIMTLAMPNAATPATTVMIHDTSPLSET